MVRPVGRNTSRLNGLSYGALLGIISFPVPVERIPEEKSALGGAEESCRAGKERVVVPVERCGAVSTCKGALEVVLAALGTDR
jgi:hypothetical protein